MPDDSTVPSLSDFAEILIKEKSFTHLTPGIHDQIKEDILTRVNDYLIVKLIAKMNDAQVAEFNKLLETKPTDEQIQEYVASVIPDATTVVGDLLFSFRKSYLGIE